MPTNRWRGQSLESINCGPWCALALGHEYRPLAWDSLQGPASPIGETQSRSRHQILYRAGHQNLAGAGKRSNTRADVNGDAADVVANHFALAGVESGTHFNYQRPDYFGDSARAANAACRTVERGKKTVAGCFHLLATKAYQVTPNHRVVMVEKIAPALVAQCGRLLRRTDDIGEEHRGEDAIHRDRGS